MLGLLNIFIMLNKIRNGLVRGIKPGKCNLYARSIEPGRIAGEEKLDIHLKCPDHDQHLLYLRLFHGRGRYYRPWAEFTGIDNEAITISGGQDSFLGSIYELRLIELISSDLPGGGKIYIPYEQDHETAFGLSFGFPPLLTRMGFLLFKNDFTWFKDWYFPEGGSEGSQKLQGEKPLNDKDRSRHLGELLKEVKIFEKNLASLPESDMRTDLDKKYVDNAFDRIKKLQLLI